MNNQQDMSARRTDDPAAPLDESTPISLDPGATTAELAVWVVLGLTFVGTLFAVVGPLAGRLAQNISDLLP